MSSLRPDRSSEEVELDRKRGYLKDLAAGLTRSELDLADLKARLAAFEERYLQAVGDRLRLLDELETDLMLHMAREDAADPSAPHNTEDSQERARESAERGGEAGPALARTEPSEAMRALYRRVALAVHPDLTTDPGEKARRERAMIQANAAYADGDAAQLSLILDNWIGPAEHILDESVGGRLVRVIRQIAQVESRLRIMERDMTALTASDLWQLMKEVDREESDGRNPLADMATQLDQEIEAIRAHLLPKE